jgi:hypothetical protein
MGKVEYTRLEQGFEVSGKIGVCLPSLLQQFMEMVGKQFSH